MFREVPVRPAVCAPHCKPYKGGSFLASGLARLVSSCVINHACAMAQLHTAEEVIVRLSQCIARAQQNVSLLLNEPHTGAPSSQLSMIFRRGKGAVDAIYDVEVRGRAHVLQ